MIRKLSLYICIVLHKVFDLFKYAMVYGRVNMIKKNTSPSLNKVFKQLCINEVIYHNSNKLQGVFHKVQ